jgi:hypothetical protein
VDRKTKNPIIQSKLYRIIASKLSFDGSIWCRGFKYSAATNANDGMTELNIQWLERKMTEGCMTLHEESIAVVRMVRMPITRGRV